MCSLSGLPADPFPKVDRRRATDLKGIIKGSSGVVHQGQGGDATHRAANEVHRSLGKTFLAAIPESIQLPSFPMWADELFASYPYDKRTPFSLPASELRAHVHVRGSSSR